MENPKTQNKKESKPRWKDKTKINFFLVISVSYKKQKEQKKKKTYPIKEFFLKISNFIPKCYKKKKKISYLNLKRGKECTGAGSDNMMVAATFTNTISLTPSNLNHSVF